MRKNRGVCVCVCVWGGGGGGSVQYCVGIEECVGL